MGNEQSMEEIKYREVYSKNGKITIEHRIVGKPYKVNFDKLKKLIGRDLFTGLKDKNKVKIYKGDIVKNGCQILEVKFGLHVIEIESAKYDDEQGDYFRAYGFYGKYNYGYYSIEELSSNSKLERSSTDGCCEVIGNIYDNKQLLK